MYRFIHYHLHIHRYNRYFHSAQFIIKLGVRWKKEGGGWKPNENAALKLEINRVCGDAFGPLIMS